MQKVLTAGQNRYDILKMAERADDLQQVLRVFESGNQNVKIVDISNSQKSYIVGIIYNYMKRRKVPLIPLITNNSSSADRIYSDLKTILPEDEVCLFPSLEVMAYEGGESNLQVISKRARVFQKIVSKEKGVIVIPADALIARLVPMDIYRNHILIISEEMELNVGDFTNKLVKAGYDSVDMVGERGEFSVRGGIIDVFPITEVSPVRIELFGDEVETIKNFDIDSQRSENKNRSVEIYPSTEVIQGDIPIDKVVSAIREDTTKLGLGLEKLNKSSNVELLWERIERDIERLEQGIRFDARGTYKPYFHDELVTFFDYIDNDLIIVDEPGKTAEKISNSVTQMDDTHASLLEGGGVLPRQFECYESPAELIEIINKKSKIRLTNLTGKSVKGNERIWVFPGEVSPSFNGDVEEFVKYVSTSRKLGKNVLIILSNKHSIQRVTEVLKEVDIGVIIQEKPKPLEVSKGDITLVVGDIEKGFRFIPTNLLVLTDIDVFGKRKAKQKRKKVKSGEKITSFTELKSGDNVVHETYGIGKYIGVNTIDIGGAQRDFLVVEYAGDDKLYVPADQVDMLQKYIGGNDTYVKVHKLGSSEWSKVKTRVKKSVGEMAEDLLALYAERERMKGYAFKNNEVWQQEFEDRFPFEETDDQLTVVEEIKKDMEKTKPMDRLLCGDVGYGKTEVAIRAAFKATIDGKQVAVLVPTTILAQQHYNTFKDRFEGYPIKVNVLSRFESPKEQREIISDLEKGTIDIIIGTHRLIQKDITFHDLGLVIIDEEQRFGVAQKEKLKEFRKNVDVLSLSATPIPRTLHMALSGARDMSVIETPPEDRHPIKTYVLPYDEHIIKEAVNRELSRGGQVYFVHNQVKSIERIAAKLGKLLPEARIAIAHGQMPENQLEKVMVDFLENKYDILVCSTIIENGLDISNVNTMIVNNADKMGLSQLYQLRGRVGRTNRIAYSYLMYEKNKILGEDAEKRLAAIREFVELGSGFKVAMKDLEIRGAGNILGAEQHGHIAAVGYEMYRKLLEEAIVDAKGEKKVEVPEPSVELNVNAYLSDKYIPDPNQKIDIYKKIIGVSTLDDVDDLKEELIDRFGPLPLSVKNLIAIARMKILAKMVGVLSIKHEQGRVNIKLVPGIKVPRAALAKFTRAYKGKVRFTFGSKPEIKIKAKGVESGELMKMVQGCLIELAQDEEGLKGVGG